MTGQSEAPAASRGNANAERLAGHSRSHSTARRYCLCTVPLAHLRPGERVRALELAEEIAVDSRRPLFWSNVERRYGVSPLDRGCHRQPGGPTRAQLERSRDALVEAGLIELAAARRWATPGDLVIKVQPAFSELLRAAIAGRAA